MSRTAVVAVGGNSLIRDESHQRVEDQYEIIAETVGHLIPILEAGYRMVVTHGNGPQVGFILLRSYLARDQIHEVPLYSCVADTQGALGFQFQLAFHNEFARRGMDMRAATVVTQVLVDEADPAFAKPSKPIGPFYDREEADYYQRQAGWIMHEDAGRGYRRVVPSPAPLDIIELDAIRKLLHDNHVVIAAGGGGIPVIRTAGGGLQPTAAVIDKDHASAMLASRLDSEVLLISTAVEHVYLHFGTPRQQVIARMTVTEARRNMVEGHFKAGSMLPKIEAAMGFLERGGRKVIITNPESIERAIAGETGTEIVG
ncbi:carbamate kinase [bacterium]|nr:carbamate kinase [candidate division CSSED10-310 bacterium]